MKRKIDETLRAWKQRSQGTSALLIDGARRVGKSYTAVAFARSEYSSHLLIDFSYPRPGTLDCFNEDVHDLDLFFAKLSALYGVRLLSRKSLVIFDEVQLFPRARQLIKHLVADGRYDYLETGSLITLHKNVKDILLPSEEEHLEMFPMDFEEFLWAMGDTTTAPYLQSCLDKQRPLGQALHRQTLNAFRKYMLVGGMPQAVRKFAETRDFEATDRVKKQILSLYREDMGKYAGKDEHRIRALFDNIPGQLSRKEKKYKLADLSVSARGRDYEDAFVWLEKAMIVNGCVNAADPTVGLAMSADHSTRKCYMGDTGLLVTLAFCDNAFADNTLYASILLDKLHVNEGMLMENIVAQMLRCKGHQLYFYSRVDTHNRANHMEIDFLLARRQKVQPVEVKSSSYRRHSSLDKFIRKFSKRLGEKYILYQKDLMVKEGVIHLPVYMAMLL